MLYSVDLTPRRPYTVLHFYFRQRYVRYVCLSVCLSVSKITQKRVHGFGWCVACRQVSGHGRTDELLSAIRITVRMPEPDCFLRYRMHCNAEFYYIGKIPRAWLLGARRSSDAGSSDAWFWGVETPLSEVNARYTECSSSLPVVWILANFAPNFTCDPRKHFLV